MRSSLALWAGIIGVIFIAGVTGYILIFGNTHPVNTGQPAQLPPTVTTEAAAEPCILRVAGASAWEPVYFFNPESDHPEGLAYELLQAFDRDLDIPIEFKARMPWERALVEVEKGTIDVIAGAYWTEERAETYSYTVPFAYDEIRVFVQRGREFPLSSLDDLIGRVGGRPAGGSYGEAFDKYAIEHLDIRGVNQDKQLVEQLLSEYIDYIVLAHWDGLSTLIKMGVADKIVALPYPIAVNGIHLMISRRSPCTQHLTEMNRVIEQMREQKTLQTIVTKYARNEDFPQIQNLVDGFTGENRSE